MKYSYVFRLAVNPDINGLEGSVGMCVYNSFYECSMLKRMSDKKKERTTSVFHESLHYLC